MELSQHNSESINRTGFEISDTKLSAGWPVLRRQWVTSSMMIRRWTIILNSGNSSRIHKASSRTRVHKAMPLGRKDFVHADKAVGLQRQRRSRISFMMLYDITYAITMV